MLYITKVSILMVNVKFSKSSLNKPSHKCRIKNVSQFNHNSNVWFLNTVKDAKWVLRCLNMSIPQAQRIICKYLHPITKDMIKYKQLITHLLYFTMWLGYGLRTLNTLSQNRRTRILDYLGSNLTNLEMVTVGVTFSFSFNSWKINMINRHSPIFFKFS